MDFEAGMAARLRRLRSVARVLALEYTDQLRGLPLVGEPIDRLALRLRPPRPPQQPRAGRHFYLFTSRRLAEKVAAVRQLAEGSPPSIDALADLVRFHFSQPDPEDAETARRYLARMPRSADTIVFESALLIRLGRGAEAHSLLAGIDPSLQNADTWVALSNAIAADDTVAQAERVQARLSCLSAAFARVGMAPLALRDPDGPLSLDNIASPAARPIQDPSAPLVSVIMPVFNAADHLGTALRALQEQTWRNLEIILVDDCSTDATPAIAAREALADPRIRVLRNATNAGCYVSRNNGLAAARGLFVTFHDSDDWSHPQKLEAQARDLLENPARLANVPSWFRADTALHGVIRTVGDTFMHAHNMSMMLRREAALARLGFFDATRASADMEYAARIMHAFPRRFVVFRKGPSAIGRMHDANLTTSGSFGFQHFGDSHVRVEYRDSYEFFRHGASREALRYAHPMTDRPFPAPRRICATTPHGAPPDEWEVDVVTAGYFKPPCDAATETAAEVGVQHAMGLSSAVLPLRDSDPNFLLDDRRDLAAALRRAVQLGHTGRMLPDERARCRLLLLRHVAALQEPWEELSRIEAAQVRVIVDAPPLDEAGRQAYDPRCCVTAMQQLFGPRVTWSATTPAIAAAFGAAGGDVAMEALWTPVVPLPEGPPRATGRRGRPVCGFVGGERYALWTLGREALTACFPASDALEMRVYGGWDVASPPLGTAPTNWQAVSQRTTSLDSFMGGLDFYLAFDAGDGSISTLRPALEAMAVGAIVLAPPALAARLGGAAVPCMPGAVTDTVLQIHADAARCAALRADGRAFVAKHHAPALHRDRLGALLAADAAAARLQGQSA